MTNEGPFQLARDESPFNVLRLLKACVATKDLCKGSKLYTYIRDHKSLGQNAYIGSTLVNMYVKCGALSKAQRVLEELPVRNVVTWTALIAGYAQKGQGVEALKCFDDMLREGHFPTAVTFASVLKACGSIGALLKGKEIHDKIANLGMLEKDIVLATALVDMYIKCGALVKAKEVLEKFPIRDVVCWSALIAGHAGQGQGEEALNCFDDMIHEGHSPDAVTFACALKACGSIGAAAKGEEIHNKIVSLGMLEKDRVLGATLVDMYVKCGAVDRAQQVLEELPVRDVVSWTALIAGKSEQEQGEEALNCFDDMLLEGHTPTAITFACVLKTCASMGAAAKGEEIHDKIASLGMLEEDLVLGNSLIDMYVKCGALIKAQRVFKELPFHDAISWSSLIAGYADHGQGEEALKCFDDMLFEGKSPTAVTFLSVLKACGSIRATAKGEEVHEMITSLGMLEKDIVLRTSLVDMYVKCGALAKAQQALEELPVRDVISWNAVISGYAEQGQGEEALKCFDDMLLEGHPPNVNTFLFALKACGSIGAAARGKEIHEKILRLGMLEKEIALGTSLMGMYVKSGALNKAQSVLEEVSGCDVVSWNALIAGYAQQGQSVEAISCFEKMQSNGVKPDSVTLVSILNACSHAGLVDQAETCFLKMSTNYGIYPNLHHYCCMTDLFSRAENFNKALSVIAEMPSDKCLPSWAALLGACRKCGEVKIGRLAFERVVCLDKSNAAAYILMDEIYLSAGMQEEANKIELMGMANKACTKHTYMQR